MDAAAHGRYATAGPARGASIATGITDLILRLAAAAALAVDAYVHAADASFYTAARGGALTQSTLFLLEAAVASLAALLVVVGWRVPAGRRTVWALAFLVAATALGGVLLYQQVDVGALGPLPNMYEPTWSVPDKVLSAYAEGAAVVLTVAGFAWTQARTRTPARSARR